MRERKHKIIAECNCLHIETRQFCIFSEDGVAVAQIRIDAPSKESRGIASKYFSMLSQMQEKYARLTLGEQAIAEYAADLDPRKHFTFKKYRYTAKLDITYQDEEYISVLAEARLTRGGELLSVGRKGTVFTAGGMIPPIEFGVRRLPADEVLVINSDAAPCRRKYGRSDAYETFSVKTKG
jgi:hypothetical protein